MFRRLVYFTGGVLGLSLIAYLVIWKSGPTFPNYVTPIVDKQLASEMRNLYRGISDTVHSQGVSIWYESIGDTTKPTILLIMGMGGSAMEWPAFFLDSLQAAGYHLIRYDHRDMGASEKLSSWDEDNPYTLEDLACDAIAILDKLGCKKVHLIGYSMGGMIAQRVVIDYPTRVHTLTSISSSGYTRDPELPLLSNYMKFHLLRLLLKHRNIEDEQDEVWQVLDAQTILRRGTPLTRLETDQIAARTIFEWRSNRRAHPEVGKRHVTAIFESGSRLKELSRIEVSTLVIHGRRDPFVVPAHAHKYASLIPKSRLILLDGMAHAMTPRESDTLFSALFEHLSLRESQ